jgi:rubrerythrin
LMMREKEAREIIDEILCPLCGTVTIDDQCPRCDWGIK